MTNLNSALLGLRGTAATIKLGRYLQNVPETQIDAVLGEATKEARQLLGGDMKERLDAFRQSVGEANFTALAAGPNLMPMFEKWEQEIKQQAMQKLLAGLRSLLPEENDVTDEDLKLFVAAQMGQI